jgi:hypothetical protein
MSADGLARRWRRHAADVWAALSAGQVTDRGARRRRCELRSARALAAADRRNEDAVSRWAMSSALARADLGVDLGAERE